MEKAWIFLICSSDSAPFLQGESGESMVRFKSILFLSLFLILTLYITHKVELAAVNVPTARIFSRQVRDAYPNGVVKVNAEYRHLDFYVTVSIADDFPVEDMFTIYAAFRQLIDTSTFVDEVFHQYIEDDKQANYSYNSNLGRRPDMVLEFDGMKRTFYYFYSGYYNDNFNSGRHVSEYTVERYKNWHCMHGIRPDGTEIDYSTKYLQLVYKEKLESEGECIAELVSPTF